MISVVFLMFVFFKQKTAYEMRISDWSSDVCSSDLPRSARAPAGNPRHRHRKGQPPRLPQGQRRLRSRDSLPAGRRQGLRDLPARRPGHAERRGEQSAEIGRAHVCTPVTNAHLVCRPLLEKKNKTTHTYTHIS